jgi:hypothetical protein
MSCDSAVAVMLDVLADQGEARGDDGEALILFVQVAAESLKARTPELGDPVSAWVQLARELAQRLRGGAVSGGRPTSPPPPPPAHPVVMLRAVMQGMRGLDGVEVCRADIEALTVVSVRGGGVAVTLAFQDGGQLSAQRLHREIEALGVMREVRRG